MIRVLIASTLLFLIAVNAFAANDRVVDWETGEVEVVDGGIEIKFSNDDRMSLLNVVSQAAITGPQDEESRRRFTPNESTFYWIPLDPTSPEMPNPLYSTDQKQVPHKGLFEVGRDQKSGPRSPSIKVKRFKFQDGSWCLIFVRPFNGTTFHPYLQLATVEQSKDGRWFITGVGEVRLSEGEAFPNQLGLATSSDDGIDLFIYDKWNPRIFGVHLSPGSKTGTRNYREENNVIGGALDFILPASFRQGELFSNGGQLIVASGTDPDDSQTEHVYLKLPDGRNIALYPGFDAESAEAIKKRETDYKLGMKKASRLLWEQGRTTLAKIFRDAKDGSTSDIDLTASMNRWKANRSHRRTIKTGSTAAAGRTDAELNLIYLPVSDVLARTVPYIASDIAAEVMGQMDGIYADPLPENNFVYVQIPVLSFRRAGYDELVANMFARLDGRERKNPNSGVVFIIDAANASYDSETRILSYFMQALNDHVRKKGYFNIIVAMILKNHQVDSIESLISLVARTEFVLPIDGTLLPHRRIEIVKRALQSEGVHLTEEQIEGIFHRIIDRMSENSELFNDTTVMVRNFQSIMNRLPEISVDHPFDADLIARLYVQIAGAPTVGPFPPELLRKAHSIPRLLSKTYAGHLPAALHGRDQILETISRRTESFYAIGYRDKPFLPFLLHGDTGTGKTALVMAVTGVLDAVIETYNVSPSGQNQGSGRSFDFGRGRDFQVNFGSNSSYGSTIFGSDRYAPLAPLESRHLTAIRKKVETLRLDPNPAKVLLIDELHADPEFLRELLPMLGNSDRKNAGVNLDGILVFLVCNDNPENPSYQELVTTPIDSPNYTPLSVKVFKDTFTDSKEEKDALSTKITASTPLGKVVGAVAGRLQTAMLFFPPIALDKKQQASLVDELLAEYESKNDIRIVMQDSATQLLSEVALRNQGGNFRSVEEVLREELNGAFARFMISNPGRTMHGYYVLNQTKVNGTRILELVEAGNDPAGLAVVVQDTYLRFINGAKQALQAQNDAFNVDAAHSPMVRSSRDLFTKFLEGFLEAAQLPLFGSSTVHLPSKIFDVVHGRPYPTSFSMPVVRRLGDLIEVPAVSLFNSFSGRQQNADGTFRLQTVAAENLPSAQAMSEAFHKILLGLIKLSDAVRHQDSALKFDAWIQEAISPLTLPTVVPAPRPVEPASLDRASGGAGHFIPTPAEVDTNDSRPEDINTQAAIAWAAGRFANQLARDSARNMFKDLLHDAEMEVVRNTIKGVVDPVAADIHSPACEVFLRTGAEIGNAFDVLFGDVLPSAGK